MRNETHHKQHTSVLDQKIGPKHLKKSDKSDKFDKNDKIDKNAKFAKKRKSKKTSLHIPAQFPLFWTRLRGDFTIFYSHLRQL